MNSLYRSKKNNIENDNFTNVEYKSMIGIILYAFSINLIGNAYGFFSIALRVIVFYFAVVYIMKKLKNYYVSINRNKRRSGTIVAGLAIGFLSNFLVAIILQQYIVDISKADLEGIKDFMLILGLLCAIPLFSEYKKLSQIGESNE